MHRTAETYESEVARIIPFAALGGKTLKLPVDTSTSKLCKTKRQSDSGIMSRNGGTVKDITIHDRQKFRSEEKRLKYRKASAFFISGD